MAASLAAQTRGSHRRRRGRHRPLSEINVTPMVDVMLVLLIVFMVAAPLLTVGVPLELPKTEASALDDQNQPLTISLSADGRIFVQDQIVAFDQLAPRMTALNGAGDPRPVFVRADGKAPYALVAQVMASLSRSGFSSIGLITDIGGPSSGVSGRDASRAARP